MDLDVPDHDEAVLAATASLVEAQGRTERLLSVGLDAASDQELIEASFELQMAADALNGLLTSRGYGPESRG